MKLNIARKFNCTSGEPLVLLCAMLITSLLCGLGLLQLSQAALPEPDGANALNLRAGSLVLYEIMPEIANACREDSGAPWQREVCKNKIAPKPEYRAFNGDRTRCNIIDELEKIKLGTLDDLLTDTDDFRRAISLRYVNEKLHANAIWLMPLFPNNNEWNIPDACDNLGSPYAVRDYFHVKPSLDRYCIEHPEIQPCWGNGALDKVIAESHRRGMRVMLDIALNHFGHNYRYYDDVKHITMRERLQGNDPAQIKNALWDYSATFEESLVHPELTDTESQLLEGELAKELKAKCPALKGDDWVSGFLTYREMFDWERANVPCDHVALENWAPGFYTGSWSPEGWHPSRHLGDNFTNNWVDVKFLFHHDLPNHQYEFLRTREYMFRIMNYWVSRGVDGFRLDHTTDDASGMNPLEWKYILGKVNYYDWVRKGRPENHEPPVYLAEEFGDQWGMNKVVDIMIDGYVGDMRGGNGATKNTSFVEEQLGKEWRFLNTNPEKKRVYILRALETHDEPRLFEHTGFDIWTGAGFWGIGATSRGTPMLLMGQEFGESWQLGFRRSDYLRARFEGEANYHPQAFSLVDFYGKIIGARLAPENRALLSEQNYYLRKFEDGGVDERIFAEAKWDPASANVVFAFHNLWNVGTVKQLYRVNDELAGLISLDRQRNYQLRNLLDGRVAGKCFSGQELISQGLYVELQADERLQWLRLELCQF